MTNTTGQTTNLQRLDDLLKRERAALVSLNMARLSEISREKELLMAKLRAELHKPNEKELELIARVKKTIHHNSHLLLSGLRIVAHQQKLLRDRSATTYGKDASPAISVTSQMMATRA